MKKPSPLFLRKPILLFALFSLLFAFSVTLFAQTTTGTSLITEMKAAIHNFTLAGELNPDENGLQSSPLSGKKTGDMLTAGEYNRILELVGQGGGGAGSGQSNIILAYGSKKTDGGTGTVNLTDTITLTQRGLLTISGDAVRNYAGPVTNSGGLGSLYIDNVRCASDMGFEGESTTMNFYSSPSCTQMLEPGSHTVRFENGPMSVPAPGRPIRTSMGWAVIAEKVSGGGGGGGKFEINDSTTKTQYSLGFSGVAWSSSGGTPVACAAQAGAECKQIDTAAHDFCHVTTIAGEAPHVLLNYIGGKKYRFMSVRYGILSTSITVTCYDNIGSGGGSGGGAAWVDVSLTDTADFDKSCEYRVIASGSVMGDSIMTRYSVGVQADTIFFGFNMNPGWIGGFVNKATKGTFGTNSNGTFTVTTLQKNCGGSGGGGEAFTTTVFQDVTDGYTTAASIKTYTCPAGQFVLSVDSTMIPSGQYSCANTANADKKSVSYNSCNPVAGQKWQTNIICGGGGGSSPGGAGANLGIGQKWEDVTSSRVKGTEYTNTTGKPIMVNIFVSCSAAGPGCIDGIIVDGVAASQGIAAAGVMHSNLSVVVPPGSKYKFANIDRSSGAAAPWTELR